MKLALVKHTIKHSVKSLGIVFGDIGTSPIYTFSAIFSVIPTTIDNVMGISSLIVWTLMLLVTIQYAWLAMSLAKDYHNEGGIIVLRQILMPLLSSPTAIALVTLLAFVGTALFIGDGVITPAISILSAVEGLKYIPNFEAISQNIVVVVSVIIALGLFAYQAKGTEKLSLTFGPIMLLWFFLLGTMGILAIRVYPSILYALWPTYAINFLITNRFIGILLLSKVILCATGSEPLYADMGHLGRKPIIHAWLFVFPVLCLIYLGQGAFLVAHPETQNIFYGLVLYYFKPFYIPILLLSIIATVIASQAMISGLFSIVYQAIALHLMPRLRVKYTSQEMVSQIFIPSVNNFLIVFVLLTIIKFKSSQNLTEAYGIAVSGTMTITAIFLTLIFYLKRFFIKAGIAFLLIGVNILFLIANFFKIPYGGYWSLLIACFPLLFGIIYALGQRRLYKQLKVIPSDQFLEKFSLVSERLQHIKGTALFLSKTTNAIPAYVATVMFNNNIMYEDNIIVKVVTQKIAFGLTTHYEQQIAPGLSMLEIRVGYLEIHNIDKILKSLDIHPKVIFYGVEDFTTKNPVWKFYIFIKKMTSSFVQFYQFPISKLHGVVVQVTL